MTARDAEALATLVALARRVGLHAPGLADQLEAEGVEGAFAAALGVGTTLVPVESESLLQAARDAIAAWHATGVRPVSVLDDDYPQNLRPVHDRPALLFVMGRLDADDHRAIAVIGTRRPTAEQCDTAAGIARRLVDAGHVVVSGLAAGIDTAAHEGALAADGRTVAVVGTGHAHTYPRENAELQHRIGREHAVLSPFWPETSPSPETFRARNAVMSGLSRGTVIVAAGERSGTRGQARRALAHGRPVFLLEPLLAHPWAGELSQRPNVHVVADVDEVIAVTDALNDPAPPHMG